MATAGQTRSYGGGTSTTGTVGRTVGTTSGTSVSSPYAPAKGLLQDALTRARGLFRSGQLSPYVPMSSQTRSSLQGGFKQAMAGRGALNKALGTFQDYAGGKNFVGTGQQQDIYGEGMGPSYSEDYLGGVARGDYLNRADPNFERVLATMGDKAATAAKMAAGSRGRYGGDYAQTEVGRAVGDIEAEQRVAQYERERQRQMEATGMMDAAKAGRLGLALNAANSRTAIDAENRNRQLTAAAGTGAAFDATMKPYDYVRDIGSVYDLDAANRAGTGGRNIAAMNSLIAALSPYGTTTTTGKQTGTTTGLQTGTNSSYNQGDIEGPDNTLGNILGGSLGGLSILKSLGGAGGITNLLKSLF